MSKIDNMEFSLIMCIDYAKDKEDYREQILKLIKEEREEERIGLLNEFEQIINKEQFKGSRDYVQGCVKGIEKLQKEIQVRKNNLEVRKR